MSETISINLWDDYYEDGYIPAGERQETHMYVEAYEGNDKEGDCKKILGIIMDYLFTLKFKKDECLENVDYIMKLYDSRKEYPNLEPESMHYRQWEIKFFGLSHKNRHALMKKFEEDFGKPALTFEGKSFDVYSES